MLERRSGLLSCFSLEEEPGLPGPGLLTVYWGYDCGVSGCCGNEDPGRVPPVDSKQQGDENNLGSHHSNSRPTLGSLLINTFGDEVGIPFFSEVSIGVNHAGEIVLGCSEAITELLVSHCSEVGVGVLEAVDDAMVIQRMGLQKPLHCLVGKVGLLHCCDDYFLL